MSAASSSSSVDISQLLRSPYPDSKLFIDGRFVPSHSDQKWDVVDPSSENVVSRVCVADESDVDAAVKAARHAIDHTWGTNLSGTERARYLDELASKLEENKERIATIESLNMGKPFQETLIDVADTIGVFRYCAELAQALDKKQGEKVVLPDTDFSASVFYEPMGVVGAIIPWNYPILMAAWKIAPALAAGCTIVLKASELSPLTVLELAELSTHIKLPAGVLNVLTGPGVSGGHISAHTGIDKLAFTGSTFTGQKILSAAAQQFKPCTLELGGKSPAIVFDDIKNLDVAVEWVVCGISWATGQICSATSRVLVHTSIYDAFVSRLTKLMQNIPIGPSLSPQFKNVTGHLGPVVSKTQYERVTSFIEVGKQDKSGSIKLLTGGERPASLPKGYFIQPTVFEINAPAAAGSSALSPSARRLWNEEIFGPVLCLRRFSTVDEAITAANDTDYGLAAAVFTDNSQLALDVMRRIKVGIAWVNCSQPTFKELPWGGVKKSGIGRELGEHALMEYLQPKQIVTYINNSKPVCWFNKAS